LFLFLAEQLQKSPDFSGFIFFSGIFCYNHGGMVAH